MLDPYISQILRGYSFAMRLCEMRFYERENPKMNLWEPIFTRIYKNDYENVFG